MMSKNNKEESHKKRLKIYRNRYFRGDSVTIQNNDNIRRSQEMINNNSRRPEEPKITIPKRKESLIPKIEADLNYLEKAYKEYERLYDEFENLKERIKNENCGWELLGIDEYELNKEVAQYKEQYIEGKDYCENIRDNFEYYKNKAKRDGELLSAMVESIDEKKSDIENNIKKILTFMINHMKLDCSARLDELDIVLDWLNDLKDIVNHFNLHKEYQNKYDEFNNNYFKVGWKIIQFRENIRNFLEQNQNNVGEIEKSKKQYENIKKDKKDFNPLVDRLMESYYSLKEENDKMKNWVLLENGRVRLNELRIVKNVYDVKWSNNTIQNSQNNASSSWRPISPNAASSSYRTFNSNYSSSRGQGKK